MTTSIPESPTNEGLNLKSALLFNEFINNSEVGYKSIDDDDILGDETTSYISGSYDGSNNCDFDNIDTFTLDKMSFEKARIFAENEEICYDTFWENDEFEVDSIFSTELESTSTLSYDESIALENADSRQGKNYSFTCEVNHTNDITVALQIFGNWILQTAITDNNDKKKDLLAWLSTILVMFNKETQSQCSIKPINPFLLKTIFKIGHVDFFTHSNECFEFTPEASEKIGEQLGIEIWKSRSFIRQNKSKLESPSSLEEYSRNVTTYKWQNLQEIDKFKIKKIKKQVSQPNTVDIKKPRHKRQTTEKEKKILEPILSDKVFPNNKLSEILSQLGAESDEWTESHVKTYWRNNRINK
ncbi:15479_t:CDS:2 [Racocetra fulgida]|uniref:15479_t:CDS:1 n=1 Tax=Racocetra fulgida TaxID=60492 RepID=A0A9N9FXN1_9GLOM|nr:15479_t:CDS:2 [Racocetra fulgida]